MKYSQAITKADNLRLNAISGSQKKDWVYEVECEVAEMMGLEKPEYPTTDLDLLLEEPFTNVYVTYLVAMYDYHNEEIDRYQNNMQIYNNALADMKAYYRRHNRPLCAGNWRV